MKEKDDLIRGKDAIEEFTGHAYEALMFHWKSAFDFPIKKVDLFDDRFPLLFDLLPGSSV